MPFQNGIACHGPGLAGRRTRRESTPYLLATGPAHPPEPKTLEEAKRRLIPFFRMIRDEGGLALPDCAAMLGIAPSTAEADWTYAKAWLKREMEKS